MKFPDNYVLTLVDSDELTEEGARTANAIEETMQKVRAESTELRAAAPASPPDLTKAFDERLAKFESEIAPVVARAGAATGSILMLMNPAGMTPAQKRQATSMGNTVRLGHAKLLELAELIGRANQGRLRAVVGRLQEAYGVLLAHIME